MRLSLFPKTFKFEELFLEQINKAVEAARLLEEMCNQGGDFKVKCIQIIDLDNETSNLASEISRQLDQTFITSLDREDIHDISRTQEKVTNIIKQISSRIGLYSHIDIPQPVKELTRNLRAMMEAAAKLVALLGKKGGDVEKLLNAVEERKRESEMILVEALTKMYEPRQVSNEELLKIIRWSRIYDRLERAIFRTEQLTETLEGIFLKNA